MATKLIDSRVGKLVERIKFVSSLLSDLKGYPLHLLEDGAPKKAGAEGYYGLRTFAWALEACIRLGIRRYEDQLIPLDKQMVEKIISKALAAYKYEDRMKDEKGNLNDVFWTISGYRLFSLLGILATQFDLNLQKIQAEIKKYKQAVISHPDIKDPDAKLSDLTDSHSYYSAYWAVEADNVGCEIQNDIENWSTLQQAVHNKINDELATYHSEDSMLNNMNLAISAVLLEKFELQNQVQNPAQHNALTMVIKKIRHACDIILTTPSRTFTPNRLVQITNDFGFLYNLPWEDVYISAQLPATYWPSDPSVVDDLVTWIKPRITLINAAEGNDLCGLVEESTPQYPGIAPAFTCFGICLLESIRSGLQQKLEELLSSNLRAISPSLDTFQTNGLALDDPRMIDTEEQTVKILIDKFDVNEKHEVDNFSSKNRILIFGPPGTGKTTIATGVVNYLNTKELGAINYRRKKAWTFIEIDPHALLVSDNYSALVEHIRQLLEALTYVHKCVIFFDESEELVRDRQRDSDRIGRLFTSAMLPFLNSLKTQPNIYFFATNHISEMDAAAIRMGRFAIKKGVSVVNLEYAEDAIGDKITWEALKKYVVRCTPKIFHDITTEHADDLVNAFKRYTSRLLPEDQVREHIEQIKIHDDSVSSLSEWESILNGD